MHKAIILFLILIAMTHESFSQVGTFLVGNGGQVVVCRDKKGSIDSIELLDFYEGRKLTTQNKVTSLDAADLESAIDILKFRFGLREGKNLLVDIIDQHSKSFKDEAVFLDNVNLKLTNDISSQFRPKNCLIEQIVTQQKPANIYLPRYIIDKELWDALDTTNKAGLVLHEVLYRIKIDKSPRPNIKTEKLNAINIRQIVYLIASDSYGKFISEENFNKFISKELGRLCLETKKDPKTGKVRCLRILHQ